MRRLTVGPAVSPPPSKDKGGGDGDVETPSKTIFQRLSVYAHAVHTPAASVRASTPLAAKDSSSSIPSSSRRSSQGTTPRTERTEVASSSLRPEPDVAEAAAGRQKGRVSLVLGKGGKMSSFVVVPPKTKANEARRFSVVSSDYLSNMVNSNKKKNTDLQITI